MELGIFIETKPEHPLKASIPKLVTDSGMSIEAKLGQS